jgi:CIC family chloride channel protein
VLLAAVTGAVVGLGVAVFERVTVEGVLDHVRGWPLAVQAVAPGVGLVVAWLVLRFVGRQPDRRATPATSDEYIRNFHEPDRDLDLSTAPARLLASVATLGTGGALGLEGPSMYLGAATGTMLQSRLRRHFGPGSGKVLMVAGAAAGVAAIFKAPATGTVFALEVPYQDDTAKRMLLPALVASACSYLVFASINGTEPLFPIDASPPFGLRELGGAVVLGLLCGLGARFFSSLVRTAKRLHQAHGALGVPVAAAALVAMFVASRLVFGESLTIGPGYQVISWVGEGSHSLWLVAALLGLRALATAVTIGGGGAGGLFIPLVLLGALAGELVGGALGETTTTLFPVVGVAAFLGAGYRTPLAAIMFVAESTGRPGFVVPGLLAAVASQLVMGSASVSTYQEQGRIGHLERRFRLPVSAALRADVLTAPPDVTVDDVVRRHLLLTRQTTVCVVDGPTYRGLVHLRDLNDVPRDRWATTPVGDIVHDDGPTVRPDHRLEHALITMQAADLDVLPVVADDGTFSGVVTLNDVVRLDQILASTENAAAGPADSADPADSGT